MYRVNVPDPFLRDTPTGSATFADLSGRHLQGMLAALFVVTVSQHNNENTLRDSW